MAQRAASRGLDLSEARRRVKSFRFDRALRAEITDRLGRFEVRRHIDGGALKRAAVAVVVVDADTSGEAAFLLTKRTPKLRAHGGQWALPGGRVDPGETIEQTALRELHEELGVLASTDDILGTLDDYPTRSGYLIAPVVVWAPGVTVTPNPAEVARAYRIGCGELFRDGSPEIVAIEESDRPIIRLPLPVATVNAPTAAVLFQFREVALAGRDTRVDHYEQPVFAWR
jgi:8-oxo-dGTP pyrophosphatase MutT (NUDIX family)